MSDPVAPAPGQPYEGQPYQGQPYQGQPYQGQPYPGQPFPGQPPAPPAKKKKTGKILLIVAIVLVVLCGGLAVGGYLLINKAADVVYAEGNCVDMLPTTNAVAVPKAVKCSDPQAAAKILKVVDGQNQTEADAQTVCGAVQGATSFTVLILTNNKTKLLCLGPNQ